jgi:hypothetical protein
VHDQRGVQQLERGADLRSVVEVAAPEHLVGGHDETGSEALSSGGAALEGLPEAVVAGTDPGGTDLGLREEPAECTLDLLEPYGLDQQSVHVHR